MSPTLALILVLFLVALGYLAFSAARGSRSPLVCVIAFGLAAVGGLGSWYSWIESQSTAWAGGYLLLALSAILAATASWIRGGRLSN